MAPGLPLSPRVQHNGPRWLVPHLGWRDDGRGCEIHIQNLVLYRPGRLQATKTPEVAWIPRLEVGKAPVTRSLRRQTWPWPISGNSPGGRATCPMEYHMALAQLPVSLDWLKHQGQWGGHANSSLGAWWSRLPPPNRRRQRSLLQLSQSGKEALLSTLTPPCSDPAAKDRVCFEHNRSRSK